MATTPKNRITRTIVGGASLFIDGSKVVGSMTSYNQGDLLVLDTSAHLVKTAAMEADGATFLGIAPSTVVNGKSQSPYSGTAVDAAQAIAPVPGPVHDVVAKLKLHLGDAFNPGDLVYLIPGDDAQTVSSAGTKAIGVFVGSAVSSAAAGQEGECLLGHRYPGDSLVLA